MFVSSLAKTFISLGQTMQSAQDQWWVIRSAAMALHGVRVDDVRDIDVIVSPNDAIRLMSAFGLENFADSGTARFWSDWILHPSPGAVPVEIFANFRTASGGGWQEISPVTRVKVMVEHEALFVPCQDELASIFEACGRPKDLERAQLLRQFK